MRHLISLILGGGKGTRLMPLTEYRSKPAVPIGGKYRLIDVPISNCLHSGINRIYVLTQFNSVSLHRHIRQAYNFDLFTKGFVEILAAQQTPGAVDWYQGTADAVRKQIRFLKEPGLRYVLILSGDQLYRMDYRKMLNTHIISGAKVTIATLPVDAQAARGFGIMQLDDTGRVRGFCEKPQTEEQLDELKTPREFMESQGIAQTGRDYLASMGIYLFDRDLLVDLLEQEAHEDFGRDIFPLAIERHHVQTHLFDGYWEDIGTIKAFFEANLEMAAANPPFRLSDERYPIYSRPRFLASTQFGDCAVRRSLVADGCSIGDSTILDSCVIGLRTQIRDHVQMRYSVVMGADHYQRSDADNDEPGPEIGEGAIVHGALIDKNVRIGRGARVIAAEAPTGEDADYEHLVIRDGIAVVRKGAVIPDGWSFR